MDTTKKDNTLTILTVLYSVTFSLLALRTAYMDSSESAVSQDTALFWLNAVCSFVIYEIPFLLSVYLLGPMGSEAMPGIFAVGKRGVAIIRGLHREKNRHIESNEAVTIAAVSESLPETTEATEISDETCCLNTELSEEIISYVNGTFSNILSSEQIEKLLDNFRNMNLGEAYEVVEKKKLPNVLEFDLIHFAWNVCRRIHDPNLCPKIFGAATAELIKASFPLTLQNYAESTIKCRLKDSEVNTRFRLKIIDIGQPLTPHVFKNENGIQ